MKIANFDVLRAKSKALRCAFYVLCVAFFSYGCAAFQVSGQIQPGRYALMRGDPKVALGYFQRAAEIDPNSMVRHGHIKEGVWTYVGRAHYEGGDYLAAQKALEQARSRHADDYVAPLYLGLVLSREGGDRQKGIKELQTGLTGLGDGLEYMEYYAIDGSYWDPGRIIRSRIDNNLTALQGKDINWPDLIASVEYVGLQIEREADEVLRQKRRDRRDSAKGDDKGT
jgi:tetratricopeptide (TPR) repeat protein